MTPRIKALESLVLNDFLVLKLKTTEIAKERQIDISSVYNILNSNNIQFKRQERDITGEQFGFLTVLGLSANKTKTGRNLWICKCNFENCHNFTELLHYSLVKKDSKSCGCLRRMSSQVRAYKQHRESKLIAEKHPLWKGYGEISSKIFNSIEKGAKNRNIEFNITIEYIWNLFLKQKRKCNLSGVVLQFGHGYKNYISHLETTASLDRIDSSVGYIQGNVQWLHKDLNKMKWDFNQDYFLDFCLAVTKHQNHD